MIRPTTSEGTGAIQFRLNVHLLLVLLLLDTAVDLDGELGAVHGGNEPRRLGEEVAHLLKGPLGGLGEDGPEENGICEVANL